MSVRAMFTLYVDGDGHWNAMCDRCSRETRTSRPYVELSTGTLAVWIDDLFVHQGTHPLDTTLAPDDDVMDIGHDDEVVPLDGAMGSDEEIAADIDGALAEPGWE